MSEPDEREQRATSAAAQATAAILAGARVSQVHFAGAEVDLAFLGDRAKRLIVEAATALAERHPDFRQPPSPLALLLTELGAGLGAVRDRLYAGDRLTGDQVEQLLADVLGWVTVQDARQRFQEIADGVAHCRFKAQQACRLSELEATAGRRRRGHGSGWHRDNIKVISREGGGS